MLRQALASGPGATHIPLNRRLIDAVTVAASRPPPQPHQKVEGKKRRKVKVVAQHGLL
jgi:hypothetical protein